MRIEECKNYEIIEKREIGDLNSMSYLLRHKKTGARVALLANDDPNKVFYIGFRTPPENSTGVAHILEHSVLCGSKEFPVKDPFVELVKGSLNTFLNAMTYPDKTIYPIASCNDKDFQNLMHVYLDAVFYPRIYDTDKIFCQEGWHYELDAPEGELTINGVVYNEMKGAFSSPDSVLFREKMKSLYPDTAYGIVSGGDPAVIPELSYEEFLDFHRKYYHPSNSYIYLYGDMDMAEKLTFLDEKYLSAFDRLDIDSELRQQEPFPALRRVVREYPVSDEAKEEESGYLSYNMTAGDCLDRDLNVAFQILDYALCGAPGAPLKQVLLDHSMGKDIYSEYDNGIRQPFFSVTASDTDTGKEREFVELIDGELRRIAREGFDQKTLLAGINHYEFRYREADFGRFPKGLMYGIQVLDSWLYADDKPFIHVEAGATYTRLREKAGQGYFEQLVQTYLIDNPHKSVVVLQPRKGMTQRQEEELKAELAKRKAGMSREQLEEIMARQQALTAWQEQEDRPEDLKKIPMLAREDIGREARKLVNEEARIGEIPALRHTLFTNGIAYIRMIFSLEHVPERLYPYVGILNACLGLLNTQNYSYGELSNEIDLNTGGISTVNNVYGDVEDADRYKATLELKARVLYDNIGKAVDLLREIAMTSDFTDEKRLLEIVSEGQSQMQTHLSDRGDHTAQSRALAYGSVSGAVSETLSGIPYFRLLSRIQAHFDQEKRALISALQELAAIIFRRENLTVDYVGNDQGWENTKSAAERFAGELYTCPVETGSFAPRPSRKQEGFMTAGQVLYVCRAGNFKRKGLPYRGTLRFLQVMMRYDYLWVNIRVKGGAYGCNCIFGVSGESCFSSYRDPNLKNTVEIYERAAETVANFTADERTMTQYIIGAVSELDTPMNPAAYGLFSQSAYMCGITQSMLDLEREQLLTATQEGIRELAEYIRAFMEDDFLCVVGNAQKIKEEKELFLATENLY